MTVRLDFVGVGPQRTGTTWVYEYLRSHPHALVSPVVKETRYFDLHHDRGEEWFGSHFGGQPDGTRTGEVGSSYFHCPEAPERIHAHNPQCRIIVTLREPVARIASMYAFLQREGVIGPDETVAESLETRPDLVETSRYATHLRRWLDVFGPDGVHVLLYEELAADGDRFAGDLCAAAGLPFHPVPAALAAPVNPRVRPRSQRLARWASTANRALRSMGFHGVVNVAKRLGLRRLIEAPSSASPDALASTARSLSALLEEEAISVPACVDVDISVWRAEWERLGIPI